MTAYTEIQPRAHPSGPRRVCRVFRVNDRPERDSEYAALITCLEQAENWECLLGAVVKAYAGGVIALALLWAENCPMWVDVKPSGLLGLPLRRQQLTDLMHTDLTPHAGWVVAGRGAV